MFIDPGVPRPMRAMNLAVALERRGHNVNIWTSAFYHQQKRHRSRIAAQLRVSDKIVVTLVPSPGYSRNIGIARLIDHAILARNLKKCLSGAWGVNPPDVCFVGYPPIEAAAVFLKWAARKGVPSIIDVKDLWPDFFLSAFPRVLQPAARLLLAPYFQLGRSAVRSASAFSAMSRGYIDWIERFANDEKVRKVVVSPLTSPLPEISDYDYYLSKEWWANKGVSDANRRRFMFVGSISPAFDFGPIINAARRFFNLGEDVQFVICGAGSEEMAVRRATRDLPNVVMPGWVNVHKLVALSDLSLASLAPYKNSDNFGLNVPNKIIDSLSLGNPIITSLRGEVERLVREHQVGVLYGSDEEFFDACQLLLNSEFERVRMGNNALTVYSEFFDFEKVYGGLVDSITELAASKGLSILN